LTHCQTRNCDGDLTGWNNGFGRYDNKIVFPQIRRHGRFRVTESERKSRIEAPATGAANELLRRGALDRLSRETNATRCRRNRKGNAALECRGDTGLIFSMKLAGIQMLMFLPVVSGSGREKDTVMMASFAAATWYIEAISTETSYI
jgi:hypothetical protein